VTRMGEWSPENTSCSWLAGTTSVAVGAQFSGMNQNGSKKWTTSCVVTQWEPGKTFAFRVKKIINVSDWSYTFTEMPDGVLVTEIWTDMRPNFVKRFGVLFSGVSETDRPGHNKTGMETTLERLAAAVE
jgi:hypothetical protein